jgi:hypothetical protein
MAVSILSLVVVLLLYLLYQQHHPDRVTVQIEKTVNGFDVYHKGELRGEITTKNTDSCNLEIYKDLMEVNNW